MAVPNLRALTEQAYSAAIDDHLWRAWTESMISNFEGQGALFWVIDASRAEMCRNYFVFNNIDPEEMAAEYLSGPVKLDPQMNRVCTAKQSEIYVDTDHVNLDDSNTCEYLAWQEDRCGTRHHMTASVLLGGGVEAGISIHRSSDAGSFDARSRRQLELLYPHIAHALQLGLQHNQALQQSWWDGLSHQSDDSIILLDERGSVLRLTERAEAMLNGKQGIQLVRGRLRLSQDDNLLQRMIHNAVSPLAAEGGVMTLARGKIGPARRLVIYPLPRKYRFLSPFEAAAMVRLIDPAERPNSLTPVQCEMFDFSPRETDLANLLLSGHSIESAAASLTISPNTAKVHLQSLFRKTETSRQSDLLVLLLGSS
jgi:DNA-binding CsgD family transcriptional regulator